MEGVPRVACSLQEYRLIVLNKPELDFSRKGPFSADVSDCVKSWPLIQCGYDNGLIRYDDIAGVSNDIYQVVRLFSCSSIFYLDVRFSHKNKLAHPVPRSIRLCFLRLDTRCRK